MYEVVITGVGIVSCLGTGTADVADALRNGRSGIVVDEERIKLGFRSPLTGRVRGFNPDDSLTRKQQKSLPDFGLQAYAAVQDEANITPVDR